MRSFLLLLFLLFPFIHSCRLINSAESTVSAVLEHIRKARIALHELAKFENATKIPELADTVGRLTLDWSTIRKNDSEGKMLMEELKEIRQGLNRLIESYKEFTYQLECPLKPAYYDNIRTRLAISYENMRQDWANRPIVNGFKLCDECWEIFIRLKMHDAREYSEYMDSRFCDENERIKTKKEQAKADLTLMAVMAKMCGYFLPQTLEIDDDVSEYERLDMIDMEIQRFIRETLY